jgi:hypothetical protein
VMSQMRGRTESENSRGGKGGVPGASANDFPLTADEARRVDADLGDGDGDIALAGGRFEGDA